MPKIMDCGVTLWGLKVQITQGLFRVTFEGVGCFYLFLDLRGQMRYIFLCDCDSPSKSVPRILKKAGRRCDAFTPWKSAEYKGFWNRFWRGRVCIPILQFSGVKALHFCRPRVRFFLRQYPCASTEFFRLSQARVPRSTPSLTTYGNSEKSIDKQKIVYVRSSE